MVEIRMDQVPHYVEFCRDVAKRNREKFAEAIEKAKAATDPAMRRQHEDAARTALDIATSHENDADELTQKFEEAGGKIHRIQ